MALSNFDTGIIKVVQATHRQGDIIYGMSSGKSRKILNEKKNMKKTNMQKIPNQKENMKKQTG